LTDLRQQVIQIVKERGLERLPAPVLLASGVASRDFIDGKAAFARGRDLEIACRALLELVGTELPGVEFEAIGGLTMGADQFAHVAAVIADKEWFVVRKTPKGRGTNKLVEGANLRAGTRVLLVDDVVTTGGSIQRAREEIEGLGAVVSAAITLVDRGDTAKRVFSEHGIPYLALVTYVDLGIDPVPERERVPA
jgi:orotate phosphoribosyltransferase